MKTFIFLFILLRAIPALGQELNPAYDSLLAKKLGANDKGMKTYILGVLREGSNAVQDKNVRDVLIKAHIDFIERLIINGEMVVAGGLGKNEKSYKGIFILNVSTIEEANTIIQNDPSVKEKLFEADLYRWTASAALPTYLPFHEKVEKYKRNKKN